MGGEVSGERRLGTVGGRVEIGELDKEEERK